jgi:hypothetical protein
MQNEIVAHNDLKIRIQEGFFTSTDSKKLLNNFPETLAIPQLNGVLIIIDGKTQKYWQHSVKKTKKFISPRINLTFRNIMFQN